ncbi:MAG: hypothetical protein CMI53_04115 [Parcubacteria group bacterium]|nr:hypothetical protein [Parcubacteria group bacterium]|tara:strand:- start:1712 stop:1993 length:282 start_codon:yes stop_codon:yes gene_type:complete
MQRTQSGYGVLKLFGVSTQPQALNKAITNHGLVTSLISAFFIILAVGLILGGATNFLGATPTSSAATIVQKEGTAFIPGQFVTNIINQGYIGN